MTTSKKQKADELRAKLAQYRSLAKEFPDGMTAKNIRLLSAEAEQELRKHGEDAEPTAKAL
jgi:hypothetical protein